MFYEYTSVSARPRKSANIYQTTFEISTNFLHAISMLPRREGIIASAGNSNLIHPVPVHVQKNK